MQWFNRSSGYGFVSILLHWLMAILIVGMYLLGKYMVDLDYYDKWYHQAPWLHESVGITFFGLLLIRIVTRAASPKVQSLSGYRVWERVIAKVTHFAFYILLFVICVSGYLVATSKGVAVEVFSLFEFPAMMELSASQADFFAEVHETTINIVLVLLFLHVVAAFKHHFIDKDSTLMRILGR